MRVIAGRARSLPLKTPEGLSTRPTTDRIKETLFNMLQMQVAGSIFVDLFAGSGGIGIEALSRGAQKCYFVENDTKAMKCIQENAAFTRFTEQSVFLKSDVFGALHQISEKEADIIFMDPPYGMEYEKRVLEVLADMHYVSEDTLVVVEADLATDFSYADIYGFKITKQKRYKTNQHVFLKRK